MEKKQINLAILIGILISLIALVVLLFMIYKKMDLYQVKEDDGINQSEIINDQIDEEIIQEESSITDIISEDSDELSEENFNNSVQTSPTVTYSTKDKTVINELESIEMLTSQALESEDKESALDKAKGVFISIVDFIFYDGEIKGVTFNQLTDAGKQKVLSIAQSIDSKIEKKFPDYKEDISSKVSSAYNKASEIIKTGAQNFSEFSREKLGDENYQSIIDAKDELVIYTKKAASIISQYGSSIFSKIKDKLQNWYENFKNN